MELGGSVGVVVIGLIGGLDVVWLGSRSWCRDESTWLGGGLVVDPVFGCFVKSFLKEFGSFGDCCGHCGGCCGQLYLSLTSPPLCSSLDG